jgi:hypothetical protein
VSSDASEGGSGGSGGSSSASPAGHGSASPSSARARGLAVGGRTKNTLRTKKNASPGLRGSGSVEKEKKTGKKSLGKDEDVDAVVAEIEAEEAERARRRGARAKAAARGGGDERRRPVSRSRAEGAVGKKAEEEKKAGTEERKAGTEERKAGAEERKAGAEEKAGAFVPLERVPVSPPIRGTLDRIFA